MRSAVSPPPLSKASALLDDVSQLCAFGERRAGTPAGAAAGEWLMARLHGAGVEQVTREAFRFLGFHASRSSLTVAVASGPFRAVEGEPLAYCGRGQVEAAAVALGSGEPADYEGRSVEGRIAMVERNATFHRSAQYREAIARGAVGLIYVSHAPDNLIQRGTIGEPEDGLGPIPAVSIGEIDGGRLLQAARAGRLTARIEVEASAVRAQGANVIGVLPGQESGIVLVGAHFDSWHQGAADNASGVAALLALAERWAARPRPRRTLVFAGWDGEELGLFGGYAWLRRHAVALGAPLRAFVNLEIPAAGKDDLRALAHSTVPAIEDAVQSANLPALYPITVGMHLVPGLFGGVIPTDIQGHVRRGHPGFCTACETPWYHSAGDTPDKIDLDFLAAAVEQIDAAVATLVSCDEDRLRARDPHLWQLELAAAPDASGLLATARVRDGAGAVCGGARVEWSVFADDFTRVFRGAAVSDGEGTARCPIPMQALRAGGGSRWLHVTAGRDHPLCEEMLPLP